MAYFSVLFVIVIFVIVIERLWETFLSNKSQDEGIIENRWTLWGLTFTYGLINLFSLLEYFIVNRKIDYLISALGFCLVAMAFWGRYYSIKSLGRFHSINIEVKKGHLLIRNGLYRYIRHPYYLSIMFEVSGITLFANAFYTFCFALVTYIPLVFIRIALEEAMMINNIGKDYLAYKAEVNAFFPNIKKGNKI